MELLAARRRQQTGVHLGPPHLLLPHRKNGRVGVLWDGRGAEADM